MQRRLYVIQQTNPRSTSYNLPLLYEIDGELAEEALAAACAALRLLTGEPGFQLRNLGYSRRIRLLARKTFH